MICQTFLHAPVCLLFLSIAIWQFSIIPPLFIYLSILKSLTNTGPKHLQQTLPETWHCYCHTIPLCAAEKSSCWRAWGKEIEIERCTKTLQQYAIFSKYILGYNIQCWAVQNMLILAAVTVWIFTLFMQDDLLEWFPVAEQPGQK